jgi:hypothetical protein
MVLFIFMGSASAANTTKKVSVNDKKFVNVTIPFTQNNGQIADKNVKYSANTFIGSVYVENNGIIYRLSKDKKSWIVSENFNGANHVAVSGLDSSKTKVNYYIGNNSKDWKKNVSTYNQVLYTNLYTGVNLHLKAHGKNIEKIYVITRNGSPNSIWVNVSGSTGLKVNKNGELEILNGSSALKLTKPFAYQMINGKRVVVPVSYVLNGTSYGYKTGAYNKNYRLIIDPLLSSTYLGGSSYDCANDVAVGKDGSVYVTGYTGSSDFPAYNPLDYNAGKNYNEWDVFVSKFSSDLSTLLESTYIGGSYSDQAKSIALDNYGNVFITGITYSTGNYTNNDFPVGTYGVNMSWETGAGDVFVTKLNSNLGFVRSAILGGNRADVANGILVDASNNVYITGQTFSFNGTDPDGATVTSYPVKYSAFGEPHMTHTYSPTGDVFVSKLNNDLTDMPSGVMFGGSGTSYANAIAIDQQNYIYITGATNAANFPLIDLKNTYPDNGLLNNKGDYDAFVVKLSSQALENIEGVALLGGSGRDVGNGLAVDQVGRVYVVGGTWSSDFRPLPTQTSSNNGKEDAFVTIMDKQLQSTLFSIYLGGNGVDVANDIVPAFLGSKFAVVGTTNSTSKFPGTTENNGYEDVFLTSFNYTNYPQFVSTSILGGANADYGLAGAIDNYGNTYLAGNTWSNDYPTTIGAYQTSKNEDQYVEDAYVSQVDDLADYEPPVVTKSDPKNNAKEVPINKVIKIVYNEPITSGDLSGIKLSKSGGNVPISVVISGNTLVITPLSKYLMGTVYTLDIPEGTIEDLAGNVADEYTTSFTTLTPLKVTTTTPTNNAPSVANNVTIKITFNKPIKAGSKYSSITLTNSSNTKISIIKSISGNVLTITKASGTFTGGTYTLTIPVNSLIDINNTSLASDYKMNFTVDTVPTAITKTDPTNAATKVATNQPLKITFSKPIYSVNQSLIVVKSSNGTVIPITCSISSDGKTLTINHSTLFAKATKYTVVFQSNSVLDRNNNYMLPYSFSFTTTS